MLDENKKITIKLIFSKYITRILFLLISWSFFYCIMYGVIFPTIFNQTINFNNIIESFFFGHIHMWYLYMIIGLYLITPFLRVFIKKENSEIIKIYLIIAIIIQFIEPILNILATTWPMFEYIINFIKKFQLEFFTGYTSYYILGWYITNNKIIHKRTYYLLGFLSYLLTYIYIALTGDYLTIYSNINILVLTYSSAIFIFINYDKTYKLSQTTTKLTITLSTLSFGVYIIHPFIMDILINLCHYTTNPLLYITINFILVTGISYLCCAILAKIPILHKLIKA